MGSQASPSPTDELWAVDGLPGTGTLFLSGTAIDKLPNVLYIIPTHAHMSNPNSATYAHETEKKTNNLVYMFEIF